MAATFRTRPWLLVSCRSSVSPYFYAARGLGMTLEQTRNYAAARRMRPGMREAIRHHQKEQSNHEAISTVNQRMMAKSQHLSNSDICLLSPRTFVPFAPLKAPRGLDFFRYYWQIIKQRFLDRFQILVNQYQTKPKFFAKSRLTASRKGVVQTALKLHTEMSQCLARGTAADKDRLSQICVSKLHRSLAAAIENRRPGKSYRWERLEQQGWPLWPRLVDHKWTQINLGFVQWYRQAVVGIKSKQRLVELDAKGKEVGTRDMELTEYVVLWAHMDMNHFQQGEWKLYGTLKETTLDAMKDEESLMNKMNDMNAARKILDNMGQKPR